MVQKKHCIAISAVLGVIAVIVVVIIITSLPENIETVTVDEDTDQASQLRVGTLQNTQGNVARGNITIIQSGSTLSAQVDGFSASACTDLQMFFSTEAEPVAVAGLQVMTSITATEAATGEFTKELPTEFSPDTTEGFLLFCASTATVLGNGAFSELASVSNVISSGAFEGVGHTVEGTISVVERTEFVNGSPVQRFSLIFENVVVDAGPDLYLYLTPNPNPMDISEVGTIRVELDDIRFFAKEGNFVQDLAAGIDPTTFQGANVWCDRFSVLFGTTTLVVQ